MANWPKKSGTFKCRKHWDEVKLSSSQNMDGWLTVEWKKLKVQKGALENNKCLISQLESTGNCSDLNILNSVRLTGLRLFDMAAALNLNLMLISTQKALGNNIMAECWQMWQILLG